MAFGTEKKMMIFFFMFDNKKKTFFSSQIQIKKAFKKQTNNEMIYFFKFKGLKTH